MAIFQKGRDFMENYGSRITKFIFYGLIADVILSGLISIFDRPTRPILLTLIRLIFGEKGQSWTVYLILFFVVWLQRKWVVDKWPKLLGGGILRFFRDKWPAILGGRILRYLLGGETMGIINETKRRVWLKMLRRIQASRSLYWLAKDWYIREPTIPGELPNAFKDLRIHLYTLMNFMLRHQVWKAKGNTAHSIYLQMKAPEDLLARNIDTPYGINKNMKRYIEGGKIWRDSEDEKWVCERDPSDPKGEDIAMGFARHYFIVLRIMDWLRHELSQDLTRDPSPDEFEHIPDKARNVYDKDIEPLLYGLTNPKLGYFEERYKTAVKRFKVVNLARIMRLFYLDMYNMCGQYERGLCFPRLDAKPDYYLCVLEKNPDDTTSLSIDWQKTRDNIIKSPKKEFVDRFFYPHGHFNVNHHNPNFLIELDLYGWCLDDINKIQVEKGRVSGVIPRIIRRFKNKDMVMFHRPDKEIASKYGIKIENQPRLYEVLHLSSDFEWITGAEEDMRKGWFHPFSRIVGDYTGPESSSDQVNVGITQGFINLKEARFRRLVQERVDTAYDNEALKNPGFFRFWGRRHYFDELVPGCYVTNPANPYPTLSLEGLWEIIKAVSTARIKEEGLAQAYLDEYFRMQYYALSTSGEEEGGGDQSGH
ncbi:hypothetical protein HYS31_05470 [Candidatus Woesearchaeota archaeon]|nr:hypothetical protein [Candidatus Woesearchaeota archaeon]